MNESDKMAHKIEPGWIPTESSQSQAHRRKPLSKPAKVAIVALGIAAFLLGYKQGGPNTDISNTETNTPTPTISEPQKNTNNNITIDVTDSPTDNSSKATETP